jgi:hypothetical protein
VNRIRLVVGDTRPQLYIQMKQPSGLIDVSAALVRMRFRAEGDDTVLFQLLGEPLPGTLQADLQTPDLTQYPTPGSGGRVRFSFVPGTLDQLPGFYEGEIEVDYGTDNFFTAYSKLQFVLRKEF